MNEQLKDKVAVVTGAGGAIGRSISLRLAREGAVIGINDINSDTIEKTLQLLTKENLQGFALPADLTDSNAVQSMFETVKTDHQRLDILVNNAGILSPGPDFDILRQSVFDKLIEDQRTHGKSLESLKITSSYQDKWWHKILDINLNGMFYCTREALKIMEENRSGRIINMASITGLAGSFNIAYAASKGAVISFTKSVAKEVIASGILVNAIAPGYIETPMLNQDPSSMAIMLGQTPAGRLGTADEIASTVAFLAGEDSEYYVGQVLSPNGGAYV